ncbi:MAG: hypothetical protein KUG56_03240 [Kordiimonadaceae bacterium]|nr:hypothetical protein [Kordiimonadaceae bacterium]
MDIKLLVYVEPLIEASQPGVRVWWLNFAAQAIQLLLGPDIDWKNHCRVVTSDYLKQIAFGRPYPKLGPDLSAWQAFPKEYTYAVSIRDCWDMLRKDCTATAKAWDEGHYSETELSKTADFMREKIGDFTPDLILTFSAVPFLQYAFPDAVVLHQEAGLLSRAPYPYTGYFDPIGMRHNSSLRQFARELKSLEVTAEVTEGLQAFRRSFIEECLVPKSPFAGMKETLQSKFDSIWIWPNQSDMMAGWHRDLPMQNMWDMMTWVLDTAGPKTGIILTEHPSWELYFSKERIDYWRAMFPNFIYLENAWNICASTQYLLDIADGVIALTSSVGFQPLLWRKKLVTLGETQFNDLADGVDLAQLDDIAHQAWDPQKDAQLYWMLTQFNVLHDHLYDGPYLADFAGRCLAAKQSKGAIDFAVFQQSNPPSKVMADLIAGCSPNVPEMRVNSPADLNLETYMDLARRGEVH